jgi:hypothetical protein
LEKYLKDEIASNGPGYNESINPIDKLSALASFIRKIIFIIILD